MQFARSPHERDASLADWFQERIATHIQDVLDGLSADEQLEVTVILNNGRELRATWFGYHNPNMLIVVGRDEQKRDVRVLVPHTNVQIVLTRVPAGGGARRAPIGFQTRGDRGGHAGHAGRRGHEAPSDRQPAA